MSVRPLAVVLGVQVLIGIGLVVWGLQGFPLPGGGDDERGQASAATSREWKVNRFDANRAFRVTAFQTEQVGPRPAGSQASRRLRDFLVERVPRGRTQVVPDGGPSDPPLHNVVGQIPGRKPAILIGAHYDTEARPVGHLGANDGAAGTAVVLELARQLDRRSRLTSPEVAGSGDRRREPSS
ncbi:MAG: M28 family peptidase, partial [Actinomycetota bacterium]|nr:M28 family peptidase [Actinomycetota bacterium]